MLRFTLTKKNGVETKLALRQLPNGKKVLAGGCMKWGPGFSKPNPASSA